MKKLSYWVLLGALGVSPFAMAGYYTPSNVSSMSNKYVVTGQEYNDQTLPLYQNSTKAPNGPAQGVGHVANTQFGNNGPGMAGCGISENLAEAVYGSGASAVPSYAKNYIALNVYSHVMGYDPASPKQGLAGEGDVQGYVSFAKGQLGYPYQQYFRNMPALYPAYQGLWNNGLNCQRWVQVKTSAQGCADNSGTSVAGASKACTAAPASTYTNSEFYGYIFDSCEDNNGWCRDDDAHIDINQDIIHDNYYLSWHFAANPYYTNTAAPATLKDVWLAWFGQASKWWSYIVVLNTPNGLNLLQYNIGSAAQPYWVSSHVLQGDNHLTWNGSSGNGDLWQIQPMNSLSDAQPSDNPVYQVRLFDVNGYPVNNGKIYQFDLDTMNKGISVDNHAYTIAYPGKSLSYANDTTFVAPTGSAVLKVTLSNLPSGVTLSLIAPVLIDAKGFSYNPSSCSGNTCTFSALPAGNYTVYGVYANDLSKDLVVRQLQKLTMNLPVTVTAQGQTAQALSVNVKDTAYSKYFDFATTYTGVVQTQLKVTGLKAGTSANGNFQVLFVPTNLASTVTAQTQGCFLHNYAVSSGATTTNCYLYYTVHGQGTFGSAVANIPFKEVWPTMVGADSATGYALSSTGSPNGKIIKVTGYTGNGSVAPVPTTSVGVATYASSAKTTRSLFWMLDPQSDAACLSGMSALSVSVPSLGGTPVKLTASMIDQPVEAQITASDSAPVASLSMNSGAANCVANFATPSIIPGETVVEMVKLVQTPVPPPPPAPVNVGVTVKTDPSSDAKCVNGQDTLTFSNSTGNNSVPYTMGTVGSATVLQGNDTITDTGFPVSGGSCKIVPQSNVNITQGSVVNVKYTFSESPAVTCKYAYTADTSFPVGSQYGTTLHITLYNTSGQNLPANWNLQLTGTNITGIINGDPWGWQAVTVNNGNVTGSAMSWADISANGSRDIGANISMANSNLTIGQVKLNGVVCTAK